MKSCHERRKNNSSRISDRLDEPELELELDNDTKAIESNSIIQPSQEERHSLLIPFLVNIFLANATSSVIVASLARYLTQIGIHESYLP